MTAQPLFDGTFSIDAVASAAQALVQQLHDEAMATIADLAEHWDLPVDEPAAVPGDEPVTYREPATWSVQDEEDEFLPYEDDEDVDVRPLQLADLPAVLPLRRPAAANVTARIEPGPEGNVALAEGDRRFVAV